MTNTNTSTNISISTLQDQQQPQAPKKSYFEKEHNDNNNNNNNNNDNENDNDKHQYNFYSSSSCGYCGSGGSNKNIKDIYNLKYEDLRKKGLKMELEVEEKNTNANSNSNKPGSQELSIFIQRGMIEWVEVWNKYQLQYPLNELNEMNNSKKIKALVYNDDDRQLHTDTDTDTAWDYAGINLPPNLQTQVKNLLVQIVMSILPNKMSAIGKPITQR